MGEIWRMTSHMEGVINAYKTLAKIPSIIGGRLNNSGTRITSKWSVRNLDKGKNTPYLIDYVLDSNLNVIAKSDFGVDVSNELLSAVSPKENFKAVIREEKNGKDKKSYLEVWSKSSLAHSIDLTALDLHGDVYADSEFGCLDWSPDEKSLVYVAEKKKPKSEPFIMRKPKSEETDKKEDKITTPGEEYLFREDWGEQLVGKVQTVVVVCRVDSETLTVLKGLPDDLCPGQVRFAGNSETVVGVAWQLERRRLGLIYCTNRPGVVFSLSVDGGPPRKLSIANQSVRSPRLGPSGDLVWLQRDSQGPHHACHKLVRIPADVLTKQDSNPQDSNATVVDIVKTKRDISNGVFYGMYNQSLPTKCFSSDGKRLLFSSAQQNEIRSYVVHIETGEIVDISNNKEGPGSTTILCVQADVVLAICANMNTPGQLYVGKLPPLGQEAGMQWVRVSEPIAVPPSLTTTEVRYLSLEHKNTTDSIRSFTAIYFGAKEGKDMPLIVWPHGGPHSAFSNTYMLEPAFFSMLGFAILLINYRGSTGSGDDSVHFLPSRIGNADVKDCNLATVEAMAQFPVDSQRVVLCGGSHGGFLVTHLSGTYPDLYKAVVARNPVIDLSSMSNTSDIPDWYTNAMIINVENFVGFAMIRINYRGSTGNGDSNVRCLMGHIGEYDVNDCLLALTALREGVERFQTTVLYGGSFGGFTAAHLASRFPDKFEAMVLRNPLVDLATKENYADNPDGCSVEIGMPFTEEGPESEDKLLSLRRCSPIVNAHKVKAATALMLGSGDKRVPFYQGLEFSRRLKANGVKTRVFVYEDNHALSSLPAEMDNLINGADWLISAIKP